MASAEEAAANAQAIMDDYNAKTADLFAQIAAAKAGAQGLSGGNNITINAPLGTEDYLTEAVQRVLQKLNRAGDSTTYAGAL